MIKPDSDTGKYVWVDNGFLSIEESKFLFNSASYRGVGFFDAISGFSSPDINESRIFRLDDHILRLLNSLKMCGLEVNTTPEEIKNSIIQTVGINRFKVPHYIHILFADFGTHPQKVNFKNVSFAISIHKMVKYILIGQPISIALVEHEKPKKYGQVKLIGEYAVPNLLHNNVQEIKNGAEKNGFSTVLFSSRYGKLLDGAFANVFGVWENELRTPQLGESILAGVTRDTIVELAKLNHLQVNPSAQIFITDLYTVRELFISGTSTKITPVERVVWFNNLEFNDKRHEFLIGKEGEAGETTKTLMEQLENLLMGESKYTDLNEKYITTVKY